MKDNNFELPFLWFMSSMHADQFRLSLFETSRQINLDLSSHSVLHSAELALQTDGLFRLAQGWREVSNVFDIFHPYWLRRKLFFINRPGSAAFASVCQIQADAGYIDPKRCHIESDYHSRWPYAAHQLLKLAVESIRDQDLKLLNQQRDIENLVEAVRALNATVARINKQSVSGSELAQ
jgi:hypothetical protein